MRNTSVKGSISLFYNPKLISLQWQTKFRNTQIACVEYDGITGIAEEQQRKIFQVWLIFPFQTP